MTAPIANKLQSINRNRYPSGLTPMLRHFLQVKQAHPDALIFYRMGDFYELFFEDAVEAAPILGIALTSRGKHQGEAIPMAGVPVRAAKGYLHKLIEAGFKVAICEQMEDPAEAKKRGSKAVVERKVIRIITPATLTEEDLLDPVSARRLVAIYAANNGKIWGLASADISTGEFLTREAQSDGLIDLLAMLSPSELIASDLDLARPELLEVETIIRIKTHPAGLAKASPSQGKQRLKAQFGVAAIEALEGDKKHLFGACDLLLHYLEHTQQAEKTSLALPALLTSEKQLMMDAATRRSLEIDRSANGSNKGSLFAAINQTRTAAGARLLRERLHRPSRDLKEIRSWHERVEFFTANEQLRSELRQLLRGFPDLVRALSRFQMDRWGPRDLLVMRDGLQGSIQINAIFTAISEQTAELSLEGSKKNLETGLDFSKELLAFAQQLDAALSDKPPLKRNEGGSLRSSYDAEMDRYQLLKSDARKELSKLQASYATMTGVVGLKIKFNGVLGYFIEVTPRHGDALDSFDGEVKFEHRQSLKSAARFTTEALRNLQEEIEGAENRALELELAIITQFANEIIRQSAALRAIAEAVAKLDLDSANAHWAIENQACRPQLVSEPIFEAQGLRHPAVETALQREHEKFTPNNVELDASAKEKAQRLLVITGPNMAGKSTYLRQAAIMAIMAQAGCFVPARSAKLGLVDQLFSRVGASDDLSRGRSTFMTEMVETATILARATEQSLVIMDEIGRGTATYDGLAIAWAVAQYLHDENACRALFATHYHELAELAQALPHADNAHLRAREWQDSLIFLHEVAKGPADRSYGIQVAKLAGVPMPVLQQAGRLLAEFEQNRHTAKPEVNRIRPESEQEELPLFGADQDSTARPVANQVTAPADATNQAMLDLCSQLQALSPDDLTPRHALELLFSLRDQAKKLRMHQNNEKN